MVGPQFSKLNATVRFCYPAPNKENKMSLKSMFQSAVNAVKFMFSPEQQNRAEDDLPVSKVDIAMTAPVTKEVAVKPAVAAKKPRKPRAPKVPEAK
jgi:hypothetical protein